MPTLEETERMAVATAIRSAHGNMSLAAKELKIDRRTLYRKAKRFGLIELARQIRPHASSANCPKCGATCLNCHDKKESDQ